MWATPRSVSTAFEKVLSRMPSAATVHEPFTNCYYFGPGRRSRRYGDSASGARYDTDAALAEIGRADADIVCVKDLAFQAEPYVPDGFLTEVTNTLMLRHPRIVMRSLLPLKPDFTEDEFGFTALRRMFRRIAAATNRSPLIIDGNELRDSPAEVVRAYCARAALPFSADMLHWSDGKIRPWVTDEAESQAKWHQTLERSTGILGPAEEPDFEIPADRRTMYSAALEILDEVLAHGTLIKDDSCPST